MLLKNRTVHACLNDISNNTPKFIIFSLSSLYSPAGSTDFAYSFETVSSDQASAGTQLGIGSTHLKNNRRFPETEFGAQLQMMVPVILGLLLVLIAVAGFAVCIKRSKEIVYI